MNFLFLVVAAMAFSWIGFSLFFVGEVFGRYPRFGLSEIVEAVFKGAKYAMVCASPPLLAFAVLIEVAR